MTLQKSTGTEKSRREREKREKHARLPAQMPASACPGIPVATTDRSGRTQCRAEKTGIMEQVIRCQDIRTGQKGGHPHFGGKLQCVIEQRKSCSSCCLANFATLQTANAGVTRTRWHRQHAIVIATKKEHQGGKNGKDRDCDAEELVKTWRQWCHTST